MARKNRLAECKPLLISTPARILGLHRGVQGLDSNKGSPLLLATLRSRKAMSKIICRRSFYYFINLVIKICALRRPEGLDLKECNLHTVIICWLARLRTPTQPSSVRQQGCVVFIFFFSLIN